MFGLLGRLTWLLVRIVLSVIFYGTPLIALWVASSLTAFFGGPQWAPWLAGALLFPIIPGLWEWRAWAKRDPKKQAWFTLSDRISMRTFVIGLAFLGALLYFYPQSAFVSLSTRGDWMLDGVKDPRADQARRVLFASAGGLEWLYRATKNNPFKARANEKLQKRTDEAARQVAQELAKEREKEEAAAKEKEAQDIAQKPTEVIADKPEETAVKKEEKTETVEKKSEDVAEKQKDEKPPEEKKTSEVPAKKEVVKPKKQEVAKKPKKESAKKKDTEETAEKKEEKPEETAPTVVAAGWPWKQNTLHPVVANMPKSAETSIESVAKYIAERETNPMMRVKALHDWVADRIAYDAPAYYSGTYPDQEADIVFTRRKGVCSGYSNLLAALASAINEEIVVVYGDARDPRHGDKLTGEGHAWNAAKIEGKWYLIDVCWDSGTISRAKGFTKKYKTDYLLTPPEVMVADHFPEDPTWQLLATPLTQGDFLRQPMLRPSFRAAGLTLVAPNRAQNEAGPVAAVIVKNPKKQWLIAGLEQDGKQIGYSTEPINADMAQLQRDLPNKGTYRLNMWITNKTATQPNFVGAVDFVNR